MPYRRLPNTNAARLRSLRSAIDKSNKVNDKEIVFSFHTQHNINCFLPKFELTIKNLQEAKKEQTIAHKDYDKLLHKAQLYISHFIQALNFCILRGEIKTNVREFYCLDNSKKSIPNLTREKDIIKWGENIINGEQKRINKGGNPIYTPSIANVKVHFSKFKTAYYTQKQLQKNTKRFSKEVTDISDEADTIILRLWNEIEEHFSNTIDKNRKRILCEEYGIKYVFRKKELEKIKQYKEAEKISPRLEFNNAF